MKVLYRQQPADVERHRLVAVNTLDADGKPQFIHSGTYEELTAAFGLTPVRSRGRSRNVSVRTARTKGKFEMEAGPSQARRTGVGYSPSLHQL